jgi:hypothetical protein
MAFNGTGSNVTSLNASNVASGTLAVARGGTGTASPSLVAGSGISVSGTWPNQTVATSGGGGVTSLNGQTGAITNTDLGAIGCTMVLQNAGSSNTGTNSTVAGSVLRYGVQNNDGPGSQSYVQAPNGAIQACSRFSGKFSSSGAYNSGGTALSGTWRKLCSSAVYSVVGFSKGNVYYYLNGLYVRIS